MKNISRQKSSEKFDLAQGDASVNIFLWKYFFILLKSGKTNIMSQLTSTAFNWSKMLRTTKGEEGYLDQEASPASPFQFNFLSCFLLGFCQGTVWPYQKCIFQAILQSIWFSLVSAHCNETDSVTRLGDILDFGHNFKAFGNSKVALISHILRQFL